MLRKLLVRQKWRVRVLVDARVAVAVEDLVVEAVAVVEVRGEDVEAAVTGILGVVTTVADGEVCILVGELHHV
jgi:hypothetical protein